MPAGRAQYSIRRRFSGAVAASRVGRGNIGSWVLLRMQMAQRWARGTAGGGIGFTPVFHP